MGDTTEEEEEEDEVPSRKRHASKKARSEALTKASKTGFYHEKGAYKKRTVEGLEDADLGRDVNLTVMKERDLKLMDIEEKYTENLINMRKC